MLLTAKASALVYEFEGVSRVPEWPGGASGVTIGVGYDVGYHTPIQVRSDWEEHLGAPVTIRLARVAGRNGSLARSLARGLADVRVDDAAARAVFERVDVPRYWHAMSAAFPGVETLPADAQGALWSLVFNRGPRLTDNDPVARERAEMRSIHELVGAYAVASLARTPEADPVAPPLAAIAAQLRSMKRLWVGKNLDGLIRRREAEAALVESCAAQKGES